MESSVKAICIFQLSLLEEVWSNSESHEEEWGGNRPFKINLLTPLQTLSLCLKFPPTDECLSYQQSLKLTGVPCPRNILMTDSKNRQRGSLGFLEGISHTHSHGIPEETWNHIMGKRYQGRHEGARLNAWPLHGMHPLHPGVGLQVSTELWLHCWVGGWEVNLAILQKVRDLSPTLVLLLPPLFFSTNIVSLCKLIESNIFFICLTA